MAGLIMNTITDSLLRELNYDDDLIDDSLFALIFHLEKEGEVQIEGKYDGFWKARITSEGQHNFEWEVLPRKVNEKRLIFIFHFKKLLHFLNLLFI
jgi:hypothetical protein